MYKNNFFTKINNIMPPSGKIVWKIKPTVLTCCIVEPRKLDELRGVLYNVAKIYGNDNVGLVIFHGTENELFVREIIGDWQNVVLYNLNVENLLISEYSKLLTSKQFYRHFSSTHVLMFQCDSYIFKKIPDCYFVFDYVGAPWIKSYATDNLLGDILLADNLFSCNKGNNKGNILLDDILFDDILLADNLFSCNKGGNGCGNGGISLRNVQTMIAVTTEEGDDTTAEDLYFDKQQMKVCFPNKKLHTTFSIEQIWCDDPCCCHQPYVAINTRIRLANKIYKKKKNDKKKHSNDKKKRSNDKQKHISETKIKEIISEYEALLDKIV